MRCVASVPLSVPPSRAVLALRPASGRGPWLLLLDADGALRSWAGMVDGSLASLTPVDEGAYKRLHLLQGQLVRTVQHVAALNPKAFR